MHRRKLFFLILAAVLLASGCTVETKTAEPPQTALPAPAVTEPATAEVPVKPAETKPAEPRVKKSVTGVCHEVGSSFYHLTVNYTPFDSMEDCLKSGGTVPKY